MPANYTENLVNGKLNRKMAALLLVGGLALHSGLAAAQAKSGSDPRLARGKYLVEGIAACGNCHAERDPKGQVIAARGLSGGMVFDAPVFKAYAPNITPDPETGIGKWSDAQLGKAIREGVRPDGSIIGPPMPIEFLRNVSDDDLAAIISYLRAQPPVKKQVAKSDYKMPLPPNYGPAVTKVTAPARSDAVKYGGYLVAMGHCMDCHTPLTKGQLDMSLMGAGGRTFDIGPLGQSVSRNITPHESGLKGWTDAEIVRAVQHGQSRDGSRLKPPMAFDWYAKVNAADMRSVVTYLKSLKPLPFGGQ
jgi:mono/diheme cytochrome c family protein